VTVTLNCAAPEGGAVIGLDSSNVDAGRVPDNMTIPAGATSNTFNIDVPTVGSSVTTTIGAQYNSTRRSAVLTVTAPALEPSFTVISSSEGSDKCRLTDNDGNLDCEVNATASRGFIQRYLWSYQVEGQTQTDNTPEPVRVPDISCALFSGVSNKDTKTSVSMVIELVLEGRDGTRSSTLRKNVTLVGNGKCGFSS
jgi:hypothetical protein